MTATIIAEVEKPMPDMRYIGIAMKQNTRMNKTKYSVVYGSNKFLAHKLYKGYNKILEPSQEKVKSKDPNQTAKKYSAAYEGKKRKDN